MATINGESIWMLVSFILTLLAFSYLFGDNPLFRFVSALLVGVTAGYFATVLIYQVIITRLVVPTLQGQLITSVPLLLSGLLLLKLSPRLSRAGNLPMALLVGVGAAVAIGGAVLGTIFGQVKGALVYFSGQGNAQSPAILIVEGVFFLLGTLAVMAYFHFGAKEKISNEVRRHWLNAIFAGLGKLFIAVTLGAVFAGVLTAGISALVERSAFLMNVITGLVQ